MTSSLPVDIVIVERRRVVGGPIILDSIAMFSCGNAIVVCSFLKLFVQFCMSRMGVLHNINR